MSDRLPQTKPEACIRALEKLGFVIRRQTGSRVILRHPLTGRVTLFLITAVILNADCSMALFVRQVFRLKNLSIYYDLI